MNRIMKQHHPIARIWQLGRKLFRGYTSKEIPLTGYAGLLGIYAAAFSGVLWFVKKNDQIPNQIKLTDLFLLGVGTHKLSRILAKDRVTSPLRAPFTRYEKSIGAGEVSETKRGRGFRRAMGDLLTCPFCLSPWVAAALSFGLVRAPRITRFINSTLAAVTISHFLNHAYVAVKEKVE